MRNSLSQDGLYINDFHRRNSMAAQREVLRMKLHPTTREEKIRQIEMIHNMSKSKDVRESVLRRSEKIDDGGEICRLKK